MYFLVKLKQTGQKTIIPQKWILNLNWAKLLSYGKRYISCTVFKVFICNNIGNEPDFHLDVKNILDTSRPACYEVLIIRSFGSLEEGLKYYPNASSQFAGPFIQRLTDEDVDSIQEILNASSDSDDQNDVAFFGQNGSFPLPLKPNDI